LIYKKGRIVICHFAHHARTACSLSEGESIRHLQMKSQLATLFGSLGRVEVELPIIEGYRADIVLLNRKIVIECQASPISIPEWEYRTKAYNAENYSVMWVWDIARVYGKRLACFPKPGLYVDSWSGKAFHEYREEYRVPAEIRHCNAWNQQIFVLDSEGELNVCRLKEAEERSNEWYDEDGEFRESSYIPKTLKCIIPAWPDGELQEYFAASGSKDGGGFWLVQFEDALDRDTYPEPSIAHPIYCTD